MVPCVSGVILLGAACLALCCSVEDIFVSGVILLGAACLVPVLFGRGHFGVRCDLAWFRLPCSCAVRSRTLVHSLTCSSQNNRTPSQYHTSSGSTLPGLPPRWTVWMGFVRDVPGWLFPGLLNRHTLPVFLIKYYDNLKIIPCHAIL